jgi:hypothetical protein
LERGHGSTHDATDRLRPLYGARQPSHGPHLLDERSQRSGAENPRPARAAQVAAFAAQAGASRPALANASEDAGPRVQDREPRLALALAVLTLGERRRDEGDGQSGKG